MIADLANLSPTAWLVMMGCVFLWLVFCFVCWRGDCDG